MVKFKILLSAFIIGIITYTAIVIGNHGFNLIQIFFGDIWAFNWSGQFNFDFMCLLLLSGLWISWRHHFSSGGILLGLLALIGGTMFLAPYLLIVTFRVNGNINELLVGKNKAGN